MALCGAIWAPPGAADSLRLASYHTGLSREGPGLLLRDILRGEDPQIAATIEVILAARADLLLLQGVDFDAGGLAVAALAERLAAGGGDYPHRLVLRPNTGRVTGLDLDGDGRNWRARDHHGYGFFNGQGGMALLSRHPIGEVRDFSDLLWSDLPGSAAADVLPPEALPVLRLASVAAWHVEIALPDGPLHLFAAHASAPVFDGPEDRNGWRNHDELRFWRLYLDGWAPGRLAPFGAGRFVLMGTLNVDPERGEGRRDALRGLLGHPRLQDPAPRRPGGGSETADWPDPDPGDLRVDYVLPAAGLLVTGSGVLWPEDEAADPPLSVAAAASDHRLVWVDLALTRE